MSGHKSAERLNTNSDLSLPRMLLHQDGQTWEEVRPSQDSRGHDSQVAPVRLILVPLDGSLYAEHALPHALAIARRSGAVVRIVHVHSALDHNDPWQLHPSLETKERRKREKRNYLRDVADRIARTDSVTVQAILIDSLDTADSLVKAAENVDLAVMASRRRGFLRRLFSYSVADAVRRRLLVPLLSVHGKLSPVDLTSDTIARQILVPLDGSSFAERILGFATAMSRLEGAALTLLNVQKREWTSEIFEHAKTPHYLIRVARDLRKSVPLVDARIVTTDGSLTSAVTSFAESRNVDLIAMATRSDRGMTRILRGSLADNLIRRTDLPILLLGIDIETKRTKVTAEIN